MANEWNNGLSLACVDVDDNPMESCQSGNFLSAAVNPSDGDHPSARLPPLRPISVHFKFVICVRIIFTDVGSHHHLHSSLFEVEILGFNLKIIRRGRSVD